MAKKNRRKVKAKKAPARKPLPRKMRGKAKPAKAAKAVKTVKPLKAKIQKRKTVPTGLTGQLYEAALKILKDRQAEEIITVDLAGRSSMADYLIIASGRASRQITAIADYLRDAFMKLGARNIRVEGLTQGNWVLVDAGDIVVHLFRPEVRRYYKLEDIWNDEGKDLERASLLLE